MKLYLIIGYVLINDLICMIYETVMINLMHSQIHDGMRRLYFSIKIRQKYCYFNAKLYN